MLPELKRFIEENIDLITDSQFSDIYNNKIKSYKFKRLFTEAMLEADINPLNYMTEVPKSYLYESTIQVISIPTGITKINDYAFSRCLKLDELYLPEGLTHIGQGAFMNCPKLEYIKLPSTLKIIDLGAFEDCRNLKYVYFAGTTEQWWKVYKKDDSLMKNTERVICSDSYGYI